MESLSPAFGSISHLIFIIISCRIFRFFKNALLTDGPLKLAVEEFTATIQLCVSSFELGVITEVYGLSGYAMGLFATSFSYAITFEDGTADPTEILDKYCKRQISPKECLLRIVASLAAAASSYHLAKIFWSLAVIPEHKAAFISGGLCTASLQVSLSSAILIEGGMTFMNRLVQACSGMNPLFGGLTDVGITFFGLLFTGGYFNPSLSLAMELGCTGLTFANYAMIYAIGPAVATLVAVQVVPKLIPLIEGEVEEPKPVQNGNKKHD